jgi:hypothetical protein
MLQTLYAASAVVRTQVLKTGVLTTLRFLFAEIRGSECYRDFSPVDCHFSRPIRCATIAGWAGLHVRGTLMLRLFTKPLVAFCTPPDRKTFFGMRSQVCGGNFALLHPSVDFGVFCASRIRHGYAPVLRIP